MQAPTAAKSHQACVERPFWPAKPRRALRAPSHARGTAALAARQTSRCNRRPQCCRAASSTVVKEEHSSTETVTRPLKVMIAGAPAAGKGTQCAKIVEKYGLVHISAGDLLRAEVLAGTEAGKTAKRFMDEGNLVPNEVVVQMVTNRLQQPDASEGGWLLDGYPRSAEQADAIEAAGIRPDIFILINVSDDELVDRVVGRRLDPVTGDIYHLTHKKPPADVVDRLVQRSDDTEEKLRNRLESHHTNVEAVIGYYKDELVEVDGSRPMKEVAETIDAVLAAYQEKFATTSESHSSSSTVTTSS